MIGDAYPTSGYFECPECLQKVTTDEHYNTCPSCEGMMESVPIRFIFEHLPESSNR